MPPVCVGDATLTTRGIPMENVDQVIVLASSMLRGRVAHHD